MIILLFFLFFSFGNYLYFINQESSSIWLFNMVNVLVVILIFLLFIVAFKEKLGIAPPKKEIKYKNEKRAKLCIRLIYCGMFILGSAILIFIYLGFLIPEDNILNVLGFQSPMQWLLSIISMIGGTMALLGLRMVIRGALG